MKGTMTLTLVMLALMLAGCKSGHMTEQQRFERSILKEFAF